MYESSEFIHIYSSLEVGLRLWNTSGVCGDGGGADGALYVGQWRGLDTRQTRRRRRPRPQASVPRLAPHPSLCTDTDLTLFFYLYSNDKRANSLSEFA